MRSSRTVRIYAFITLVGLLFGLLYASFLSLVSSGGSIDRAEVDPLQPNSNSNSALTNRTLPLPIVVRPRPAGWDADPFDYPKPIVFFDVAIDGKPAGRIVFELFTKQSPLAAENFRALCTGEMGFVPNEPNCEGPGKALHFKGARFYRVIDKFICQTGAGTDSVFGGAFKDDPGGLMLKHNKKGLLSVANAGPDTTTSHFSILMGPAPHLNGHYVIFGQVVSGLHVVDQINSLARMDGSRNEEPTKPVVIVDCGQLKCKKAEPGTDPSGCQPMDTQ